MGSPPDVFAEGPLYARLTQGVAADRNRKRARSILKEAKMTAPHAVDDAIKVGVIADQTGPLSFVGAANTNVARMLVGDINAKGGLLGRQVELIVEDGGTDDAMAEAAARKLVEEDRVHVIFGGIYSS